uniref:Uncharacterized protein n=2 Tax=Stomoxys calcitrans TaxID=35570 RepID=A0A1I8PZG7_STOCA
MDKPSSGNVGRSRGRASSSHGQGDAARGRRHHTAQGGPGGPSGPGGPGGSASAGTAPPSMGGQRPMGMARGSSIMKAPAPTSHPQQRPPAPTALGRATTHRDVPVAEAAGGAVVKEDNRGAVRGKRVIPDLVHSRPQDLVTKCGKIGAKVPVQANYFRILKKPHWSIHQYRVDFRPDVDLIRLRRAYLGQHKAILGGFIFDGTVLFSTNHFTDQSEQKELLTKNREGETIQIILKHVGIVDVTDAQQIQVLNLILRRSMEGLKLQLVGRNFFDPRAKVNVDSFQMEIWPGYQTSIRQHEQDILLCAEITHKVMRTQTVYNILTQCLRDSGDYQADFKRQVVGSIVLTDYNNKTYRVDDVDFQSSPSSKFSTRDGEISYVQYYKQRYNLPIRDERQPLLISRPTEKNIRGGQDEFIMLVPELCRATGLTDAMRSNFKLMRAMGEHTRLNPNRRIERLRAFNTRLQNSSESMDVLALWNMQLDRHLVEIPGRILPSEKIVFGNQATVVCDANADWSRDMRNKTMFSHVDIKRWYVIVPKRSLREVQEFVKCCIRAAASMRMHISEPRYEEMPDDRNGSYATAIDRTTAQDPQILMLVLPNSNEEKYSCIKKKCCVDRPVPSQVVTLRVIAPRGDKASGLMSIATKVIIQMNAKLMGAPWMIDLPLSGLMTVGFDVCHSAKERNKSYGALVATMDIKQSTKYFSAVTQHLKGQELSNEITMNMTCALKSYRAVHGTLPARILFYRDGVGDGQLHQVVKTEVQFLKKKLDEIYRSAGVENGCRLAFIVVSKRINTRYFVNGRNPDPGTVVDDIITLPERYDFFLVSQSVRQGTVSPTSYNVIHDTMGMSADRIQILTYKMTHLYYNWSGTLRVPAVCQYAHKLAFLVAESIHRCPSNVLENQLYFL